MKPYQAPSCMDLLSPTLLHVQIKALSGRPCCVQAQAQAHTWASMGLFPPLRYS